MAGEIIMSIVYGIEVLPKGDPYIATAEKGVETIAAGALPGAFLVDTIPALKYIPEWMPFAGFKRKAREWRKIALMTANMPFEATKQNIVSEIIVEFHVRGVTLFIGGRDSIVVLGLLLLGASGNKPRFASSRNCHQRHGCDHISGLVVILLFVI
jgi:hypothetical protein